LRKASQFPLTSPSRDVTPKKVQTQKVSGEISRQAQSSLLFEQVITIHCLGALDLGAGVEPPISYLIKNCQSMQYMGRSRN